MGRRVIVEAPAKINLHLRVLAKRQDGFHDIFSLFQALSLGDTLAVEVVSEEGVRLIGDFDCPVAENTIFRAAHVFLREAGLTCGLEIRATKRIPAGAGLGGGSSDAAAVLSALNRLFDDRLSRENLASLGASVGSDVPFFLQGPCAIVSGRGEVVKPIPGRDDFFVAVLFPGFPTHTAAAYAAVDAARNGKGGGARFRNADIPDARWLQEEYSKSPESWSFRNDFYEALADEHPELDRAYRALKAAGADFVSLTGSGSAFFGVFRTLEKARTAVGTLNGREEKSGKWSLIAATPLARMPASRLE